MTEEDKKYRQGRSFKQREEQYKFVEFMGLWLVISIFVWFMYNVIKFIYG